MYKVLKRFLYPICDLMAAGVQRRRDRPAQSSMDNHIDGHLCKHMIARENSDACDSIDDASCFRNDDSHLLSEACLKSYAPIVKVQDADITAVASAWTEIHQACGAIDNEADCLAKTMDVQLQQGVDAMASMDADAASTREALLDDVGAAQPSTEGMITMIVLGLLALAL